MPPINGNLLLADHADTMVIIGKNPITANTANRPKSMSATTHPGATGTVSYTHLTLPTILLV